jgi:UDPglucose 6-dehydrogenase
MTASILVIGTGYVGLVSGACLADLGNNVICIDNNQSKIDQLHQGAVPIYEPGLEEVIARNVTAGRLSFDSKLGYHLESVDAILIAVGTPTDPESGKADTSYVFAALETVLAQLTKPVVFITKSTVPVGTGKKIAQTIQEKRPDLACSVVSNPEFLREGSAIYDFLHPDRIIVGTNDEQGRTLLQRIYEPLVGRGQALLFTDIASAELIKYTSNAFLATKIAFINEVADMCESTGANIDLVTKGMGMDKRIGNAYMSVGPGYGGSCFPKDTRALVSMAKDHGNDLQIVPSVIASNEARKTAMATKIITACGGDISGKTIAILGLTFKANTDDMRDSASLAIIPALVAKGAKLKLYDPQGMEQAKTLLGDIATKVTWCDCVDGCVAQADALVIITEWPEFSAIDPAWLKTQLSTPLVVDLRNIYDPEIMRDNGFSYLSLGR